MRPKRIVEVLRRINADIIALQEGIETPHMMRKGQLKRIGGDDVMGQVKFVESLFQKTA